MWGTSKVSIGLLALFVAAINLMAGCATTNTRASAPTRPPGHPPQNCPDCCQTAVYSIYSDPPGAQVYETDGGQYMGETSETVPVRLGYLNYKNYDGTCEDSTDIEIRLEKRGYKPTLHHWRADYLWVGSAADAQARSTGDPRYKVVVVLQTE